MRELWKLKGEAQEYREVNLGTRRLSPYEKLELEKHVGRVTRQLQ